MAKPKQSGDDALQIFGSEVAYTRFLPVAVKLDADGILPMRADAALAHHNVAAGVAEVLRYEEHLREHLPHVDLAEIKSLPDLALGVVFAGLKANSEGGSTDTRALLVEAHALRQVLLVSAQAAALAGIFTPQEVAKVKESHGAIDAASDCAALASLFTKHAAALEGKTAVTSAQVDRAAELGAELLRRLKTKASRRKGEAGAMSAIEARDRLWTLLCHRHERLWAVGAYVFGHAVEEMVPDLLAPVRRRKGERPA